MGEIRIKTFAAFIAVIVFLLLSINIGKSINPNRMVHASVTNIQNSCNICNSHCVYPLYASSQSKKKVRGFYDQDGDGILDRDDRCPNIPGPARTNGCPDSDGDGVADFEDECAELFGLAIYLGCPDTDGDGIPDHKDVCPFEMGLIEYNGCPETFQPGEPTAIVLSSDITDSMFMPDIAYVDSLRKADSLLKDSLLKVAEHAKTLSVPSKDLSKTSSQEVTPEPKKSLIASPFVKLIQTKKIISELDLQALRNILSKISFDEGRITMGDDTRSALDGLAELLRKNQDWQLVVHSYAAEADNNYRNLVLSQNRGDAIRTHLLKKQIPSNRIERKGYGNIVPPDETSCISHIDIEIRTNTKINN